MTTPRCVSCPTALTYALVSTTSGNWLGLSLRGGKPRTELWAALIVPFRHNLSVYCSGEWETRDLGSACVNESGGRVKEGYDALQMKTQGCSKHGET